jgi:uncharacterized protein (DUF58 family)
VTRRLGLTGSGLAVLMGGGMLLGAGGLLGYPVLTGLGAAGVAAVLLAMAAVAAPTRLAVERDVTPDRVTAGNVTTGRLVIRSTGRLPVPRFTAVERLDGKPLPVPVAALPAGASREITYPVPCPVRGMVRLGPLVLERRDPFRLARRSALLAGERTLWVHPRIHRVRPLPVGVALDFEGRLTDSAPRGSTAFAALREYLPGDDPRQIHWLSSARRGKLVVREHVDTTEPTVALLVDIHTLGPDTVEPAIELAASVAVACERIGHTVTMAAPGEDRAAVRAAGGRGILDRLAALKLPSGPAGTAGTAGAAGQAADLLSLAGTLRGGGALVTVTGEEPGLVRRLAAQRGRFSRVIVAQFVPDAGAVSGSTVRLPGLTVLRAHSGAEAAATFSRMIARSRS